METAPVLINPPPSPTSYCSPKIPACRQAGKLLCLSVGLVVLAIVATASFLLGKYSSQNKTPTPTAKVTPTPLPRDSEGILRGTPTPDLTVGWKTYQYDKCGNYPGKFPFYFKIPPTWTESITQETSCCTNYSYKRPDLKITVTCGDGFGGGGCGLDNKLIQDKFTVNGKTISGCLEKITGTNKLILGLTYLNPNKDPKHKPTISFTAEGEDTPDNRQLINQILSTFKFLD